MTIRIDDKQFKYPDAVSGFDFNHLCLNSLFQTSWKEAELQNATFKELAANKWAAAFRWTSTTSFRRERFKTSQTDVKLFPAFDLSPLAASSKPELERAKRRRSHVELPLTRTEAEAEPEAEAVQGEGGGCY